MLVVRRGRQHSRGAAKGETGGCRATQPSPERSISSMLRPPAREQPVYAAERRRLAINHYAAPPDCPIDVFCGLLEAEGCGGVGLVARSLAELPLPRLAHCLADHGLVATSLNSTGYVLHADPVAAERQARLDDQLFEAALLLGAPINLIPGGMLHGGLALAAARTQALDGIARLMERANAAGVVLALEPMHPVGIGTKGCINQLSDTCRIMDLNPGLGLTLDLFHSWWDADLVATIQAETARLRVVQVCDVALPPDGSAPRRVPLGEGVLDVADFLQRLGAAGYAGMIEYELFADQLGAPPIRPLVHHGVQTLAGLLAE
ncbi:MAG: sugar phosphate isomerase/epimerase [Geminicoccaceae bacterium]|nr:MAG: sugar phosphate isomerase/epimerase [Geminicoccaceae bacterium]